MIPRFPNPTLSDEKMKTALYPGSFNPFTIGHLSILERGLRLFDRVVVAVGHNIDKNPGECEAFDYLSRRFADNPSVEVIEFDGLTIDAARRVGAQWLLRGVRSVADYEYERNLADVNRRLSGIDTVIFFAEPELAMVSSSMVRELSHYGHAVDKFLG